MWEKPVVVVVLRCAVKGYCMSVAGTVLYGYVLWMIWAGDRNTVTVTHSLVSSCPSQQHRCLFQESGLVTRALCSLACHSLVNVCTLYRCIRGIQ